MLDNGYWEGLKIFFENEYNGITFNAASTEYVEELKNGEATILDDARRFDPKRVAKWIRLTQREAEDEVDSYGTTVDIYGKIIQFNLDETEMVRLFPHLFDYYDQIDEIAAYFMWEDINKFKEEMRKGTDKYIAEAIRLNWVMMLGEIPIIRDIFIF